MITITYKRDDEWTRRITIDADGIVGFPDGVPITTDRPEIMTLEYAIKAFNGWGYRLHSTTVTQ